MKSTSFSSLFSALIVSLWGMETNHSVLTTWHGCCSVAVMFNSLRPHGLQPARLLCPWSSPGKNTGVGCYFLLQGILPEPDVKPTSFALQVDSLPLSLQGGLVSHGKQTQNDTELWMGRAGTTLIHHCAFRTKLGVRNKKPLKNMHLKIQWNWTKEASHMLLESHT